ncbi:NCS1 family nucleobase:cation symporter-1 [Clostridium tyrobutyricum]|uniref:NCS1 family nucleobase:cation symporter-1 n=1 Tax=Clostridium tyrobutyricum TaxID=1519 RepID=UPI001C390F7C|nr:NCS1 family nucleobase:cation symporter-1 [Clostridium tyrobutyricum]MBV4420199.1 NCS1 family nucleobase:cation symporter-1 [Clostridium tyrobutyricum]
MEQAIDKKVHELDMEDNSIIKESKLYNDDIAPVAIKDRTWNTYNFTALWVGMAHCIPTYMMAGSLIALGMDWKQALFTITIGNLIVLIPILLNAHPGTKYGINFPVFSRASFGVFGANIPAILRAVVACGWFGINTYIGGSALNVLLSAVIPGWKTLGGSFQIAGLSLPAGITFMIFWTLEMFIIFKGMEQLKKFENWAAPLVLVLALVLMVWAISSAHGFGPLLSEGGKLKTMGSFMKVFPASLTSMIGFWATLSLNIPDFTRYAKGQKEQVIGQAIGLPVTMTIFSAMGIIITSATAVIYGQSMWDPVQIISKFTNPIVIFIGFFGIVVASLSVNIAANIVSPANDFSNVAPKHISFKMGGLITGIIGILIMPWKLLADPSGYIYSWLDTYSGILGPVAAIIICDYWIVKRKKLNLKDLYMTKGDYTYSKGFNPKAIIALAIGIFAALIGKIVPGLSGLFSYAWFVGFGVSFVVYYVLNISSIKSKNIDEAV